MKKLMIFGAILLFGTPFVFGQELHQDIQGVWHARVLEIQDETTTLVPGTDVQNSVQIVRVELLDGERKGEHITFENDFIQLEKDDQFFLNYLITIDGREIFSVREVDRRSAMFFLFTLFAAVILLFGGWQGLRSLLSLAGSLLVIIYILVPTLLEGYSPIPISIGVASAVLFFAIFFTHGFNKRSAIAYSGTLIAVGLTGLLAFLSINGTGLTGFSSDESVYLNLGTGGQLDFVGLLLAAIIIGALGVLDDIAVTQVAVVRELLSAQTFSPWEVYRKAMRVGREHVGALVNTLVLAYTGAALPLLLLFSLSDATLLELINRELFAAEIVRALVGSIGLILTVPITTILAVYLLKDDPESLTHNSSSRSHHQHYS